MPSARESGRTRSASIRYACLRLPALACAWLLLALMLLLLEPKVEGDNLYFEAEDMQLIASPASLGAQQRPKMPPQGLPRSKLPAH